MWSSLIDQICAGFLLVVYICYWRSNYHSMGGWDCINRHNPATFLCLFQVKTWNS